MKERIFRECEVISVYDEQDGLRIKVKLDPEDNGKSLENIPWCYPLLPRHFHINPKQGEMVLIITSKLEIANSHRWFIGPIISQQYGLANESYLSAQSLLEKGTITKAFRNPSLNPDNNGTCPEREDVAIQGRDNADLILKKDEVRLRCGFKMPIGRLNRDKMGRVDPLYDTIYNSLVFNREDLAYIQMKYKYYKDTINNRTFYSTINVVADRINLLSHDSRTPFALNDPDSLITDEELLKIIEKAHPLPYGDKLIDFLKQLIEVIRTHTHKFSMDPPCFTTPQDNVLKTNLDEMLSTSIRIN